MKKSRRSFLGKSAKGAVTLLGLGLIIQGQSKKREVTKMLNEHGELVIVEARYLRNSPLKKIASDRDIQNWIKRKGDGQR